MRRSWFVLALGALIFQSCMQDDGGDVYDFERILQEDIEAIDNYVADKGWVASIDTASGLRYVIHVEGDQAVKAESRDTISLHYHGELLDGTLFDSSTGKAPLDFILGQGSLIIGFEIGVSKLHEMDSATILIPSVYAYQDQGSGPIPPNSPLVFGIKMLDIGKWDQ